MEYLSRIFVPNISAEYFRRNAIKKKEKWSTYYTCSQLIDPQFSPKKLDLTPNCAILCKMDLKKLHPKISSNISSQNDAQTGHFTQEIKDILQ